MFGVFKSKASKPVQSLFRMSVKVGRGSNADMPATLAGAFVPVYAAAENHEDAARKGVSKLVSQGFEFLDFRGLNHQLDAAQWSGYVAKAWPEFASNLPNQAEVLAGLNGDLVIFGPFAGYEPSREG
ncbi:MAG: hypothetical protein HYX42_13245 [Polaromonas sp.]|uniref:hypothetical protein n=1 Tax=Polaromonas sp. TaxID=1869339 RepID=UPI0025CBB978|nr:hypothetical protein [Polaromonas sp.]MBI2727203.1 hypothetical protein [Polaromonas sp.]